MQTRVLVVEDSATQAMALCAVLEAQQFAVHRVASAEDALAYLDRTAVDLVLSDIVMPGMSGYDLCRCIKEDDDLAHLPVVLLTSLGDPLDIVRGLECGADNYVTKPYDPEYLCARIRNVLDRQRLRRSQKASLGVNVSFLGTTFSVTSDKEQILDLFISSVEDVVRTNQALQDSQRELATAQTQLEEYAQGMFRQAQHSTERYAALMHQASDAIIVLHVDGTILEANVRATELLGTTLHELCGRPLHQFATSDCAPRLTGELERLRDEPRVAAELDFIHPAGRIATCGFSASRTMDTSQELVLVILHDVTELRAATNRARMSQAKLEHAQHVAAIGSWERDLATDVSTWSAETCRILGVPNELTSASSERFLALVHPDDRGTIVDGMQAAVVAGRPIDEEFRIVRADGAERVVRTRGMAVCDEAGVAVSLLGMVQDVTDQKELEAQLRQAQKMEAVGQLAGGVAHDFNNLLTVITSYSAMLLKELPPGDLRTDIEEIARAAQRAEVLTRQLLAFSRQQVLQPQRVDVSALTLQLRTLLRRLVREDIEIVTVLDADAGAAWADPGQLEQVLVNLVVNARDAMPDGGTVQIRTSSCDHGPLRRADDATDAADERCVLIEVSDTGTGMSPEVQARIFEPFFTTKEVGKGTGLGLATVFGIIQQSGGEIVVDSAPGRGTTFRIYLPRDLGESSSSDTPAAQQSAPRGGGETVLVVEDDDALRAAACRMLRLQGYDVLEAPNGREALEQCGRAERRVHLVLSDIVMPEMSGHQLGQEMATRHPETKVLFMSGYSRDSVIRESVTQTGAGFLQKPFTPDALAIKVREVLDAAPMRMAS